MSSREVPACHGIRRSENKCVEEGKNRVIYPCLPPPTWHISVLRDPLDPQFLLRGKVRAQWVPGFPTMEEGPLLSHPSQDTEVTRTAWEELESSHQGCICVTNSVRKRPCKSLQARRLQTHRLRARLKPAGSCPQSFTRLTDSNHHPVSVAGSLRMPRPLQTCLWACAESQPDCCRFAGGEKVRRLQGATPGKQAAPGLVL